MRPRRNINICAGAIITLAITKSSAVAIQDRNVISCFATSSKQNDLSLVHTSPRNKMSSIKSSSLPPLNILRYRQYQRDGEEALPLQLVEPPFPFISEMNAKLELTELTPGREVTKIQGRHKKARTRRIRLRRFLKAKASKNEDDELGSFTSVFAKTKVNRKRRRERRKERQSLESQKGSEMKAATYADVELNVEIEQEASLLSLAPEDLDKWAYATDVDTLRGMFGTNRNKFWGDFDNETSRRLYHTLLPRALIGLYKQGLQPDELAPLAFEARKAAKEYARERCNVPGRLLAMAYDGFRHLKTYGSWSSNGLTWEEIWSKYELQVKEEILELWGDGQGPCPSAIANADLSSKVCLKILERSCITNEQINRLVLKQNSEENEKHKKGMGFSIDLQNDRTTSTCTTEKELDLITSTFEKEIKDLKGTNQTYDNKEITMTANVFFALKLLVSTKRKLLWFENWIRDKDNDDKERLLLPESVYEKIMVPKKKIWECDILDWKL